MNFSPQQKKEIVLRTRLTVSRLWPDLTPEATCLQSAIIMQGVLHKFGIRAVLQSGNVSWDCGEQTVYDGDSFGYHFTVHPGNRFEYHAWLGVPETQELVDVTTGVQPEQMRRLLGGVWREDLLPPDFLWSSQEDSPYLQNHCRYVPTLEATAFAHAAAAHEARRLMIRGTSLREFAGVL